MAGLSIVCHKYSFCTPEDVFTLNRQIILNGDDDGKDVTHCIFCIPGYDDNLSFMISLLSARHLILLFLSHIGT